MSVQIDDLDDLKALLKACKLNVGDIEELKSLLATINANYNPDEARVRVAKRLGIVVPSVAFGAAGVASMFLSSSASPTTPFLIAELGVVWGVTGLVSLLSTIFTAVILIARRPAEGRGPTGMNGPLAHAIMERPVSVARPNGP